MSVQRTNTILNIIPTECEDWNGIAVDRIRLQDDDYDDFQSVASSKGELKKNETSRKRDISDNVFRGKQCVAVVNVLTLSGVYVFILDRSRRVIL